MTSGLLLDGSLAGSAVIGAVFAFLRGKERRREELILFSVLLLALFGGAIALCARGEAGIDFALVGICGGIAEVVALGVCWLIDRLLVQERGSAFSRLWWLLAPLQLMLFLCVATVTMGKATESDRSGVMGVLYLIFAAPTLAVAAVVPLELGVLAGRYAAGWGRR